MSEIKGFSAGDMYQRATFDESLPTIIGVIDSIDKDTMCVTEISYDGTVDRREHHVSDFYAVRITNTEITIIVGVIIDTLKSIINEAQNSLAELNSFLEIEVNKSQGEGNGNHSRWSFVPKS